MNYNKLYKDSKQTIERSLLSVLLPGDEEGQEYVGRLISGKEPIIQKPMFQTVFPWKSSGMNISQDYLQMGLSQNVANTLTSPDAFENLINREAIFNPNLNANSNLRKQRINELRDMALFDTPYQHQVDSWQYLLNNNDGRGKTIVVTTGTGSGKTECFMVPILQYLYDHINDGDGLQALFLYPLNALMNSQQERMDAWCRVLSGDIDHVGLDHQLTYAIYNSDLEDRIREDLRIMAYPRIVDRALMRTHIPKIMFTNPTMLNYMLMRAEDRPILDGSRGKLKWIVLDEAHSYTGSTAAELSLQIRRVVKAFGCDINQINFAITSATIGDEREKKKLINFVSQLTGKDTNDIKIITGKRIVPTLDESKVRPLLDDLNSKYDSHITVDRISQLRDWFNESPSLYAEEIANNLGIKIPEQNFEKLMGLMDDLSQKRVALRSDGKDDALLPNRLHLFIRNIQGIYCCTNKDCPSHQHPHHPLGSFTTYQSMQCPECGSPLLEVCQCTHCGELHLLGEQNNNPNDKMRLKIRNISLDDDLFDDFDSAEDDGDQNQQTSNTAVDAYQPKMLSLFDQESRKASNLNVLDYVIRNGRIEDAGQDDTDGVFQEAFNNGEQVCPKCGEIISESNVKSLGARSQIMSLNIADILLENADPAALEELNVDSDILHSGKKYISFADNRDSSARYAMLLNREVERNWFRSSVYHFLSDKRLQNGRNEPYGWNIIKNALIITKDFKTLHDHLEYTRNKDIEKEDYLDSIYLDQMGWIPRRNLTLENMGLIKMVYPELEQNSYNNVPDIWKQCGLKDEEWPSYLKICADYFLRKNRYFEIPNGAFNLMAQRFPAKVIWDPGATFTINNESVDSWPHFDYNSNLRVVQRPTILILLAAMGITEHDNVTNEDIRKVNVILDAVWGEISAHLLTRTQDSRIDNGQTYFSYYLDLRDSKKVMLQLVEKAWVCPVNHVAIDTIFYGYSPKITGKISKENFERFKLSPKEIYTPLEYPAFPYPNRTRSTVPLATFASDSECDEAIETWVQNEMSEQVRRGLITGLHTRIYEKKPIYLAAEHSAQQQHDVLRDYEQEFKKGHLNVLSCSTTMEMGVDIGSITEVVMNDVPPKPANYLQRAGRAGRRNQTMSLALTFCAATPIGMNTWSNPGWIIRHKTAMPEIKLESIPIIQRHVNSYLFSFFVSEHGGLNLATSIRVIFGLDQNTINDTLYKKFCNFLTDVINGKDPKQAILVDHYNYIIQGTIMAGLSIAIAAQDAQTAITDIYNDAKSMVDMYNHEIQGANTPATAGYRTVMEHKLENYMKQNILTFLTGHNYIPSAGMPTGIITFDPYFSKDYRSKNTKKKKLVFNNLPTRTIAQALSSYAPGNNVVINEWTYRSKGILTKTIWNDTSQLLKLQHCPSCGYTTVGELEIDDCPQCTKRGKYNKMIGLRDFRNPLIRNSSYFTQIVEPVGFATSCEAKANRSSLKTNRGDFVQPLLLNMKPWMENSESSKLLLRTSTPESQILFYNYGNKNGYAYCPYCGRMVRDNLDPRNPLEKHKHLRTGGKCEGNNANGSSIKRNVLLAGKFRTDFVELKLYDHNNHEIKDQVTLYSVATIMSRMLAQYLGVNDDEINYGYSPYYHSVFIYDTAIGGAGYSTRLVDYIDEIIKMSIDALKDKEDGQEGGCDCQTACVHCLIDRRSQWYLPYLDRHVALQWLEMEQASTTAPDDIRAIFSDAVNVLQDIDTVMRQILTNNNVHDVYYFISSDIAKWKAGEFPYMSSIKNLASSGKDITLVLDNGLSLDTMLPTEAKCILETLTTLDRVKLAYLKKSIPAYQPLISVEFTDRSKKLYLSKQCSVEFNSSWGDGSQLFSSSAYSLPDVEIMTVDNIITSLTQRTSEVLIHWIKDREIMTRELIDKVLPENTPEEQKLVRLLHASLDNETVSIEYSERYLNSPLGCIILCHILKGLKERFNLQFDDVSFLFPSRFVPRTSRHELESDFQGSRTSRIQTESAERNEFLTNALKAIVGANANIQLFNQVEHDRCLTITTENGFRFCLMPDGGVCLGWKISRNDSPLDGSGNRTRDYLEQHFAEDIVLFNQLSVFKGIKYFISAEKTSQRT